MATEESDNPDLRDRAYIYWRLLARHPKTAYKILFSERPSITEESFKMESGKLDTLIANIGTLSSIYQWPPTLFVQKLREGMNKRELAEQESSSDDEINEEEQIASGQKEDEDDSFDLIGDDPTTDPTQTTSKPENHKEEEEKPPQQDQDQMDDLLDMNTDNPP